MSAGTPEPPPVARGESVTPKLLAWIASNERFDADTKAALKSLVEQRHAYGMAKYGQPLMTLDGRNTSIDAKQEAGDLLQYVFKACLTGCAHAVLDEVQPVIRALQVLRAEEHERLHPRAPQVELPRLLPAGGRPLHDEEPPRLRGS